MARRAKHTVSRKPGRRTQKRTNREQGNGHWKNRIILLICILCVCAGLWLWKEAFSIGVVPAENDEPYRPEVGDPPYRVAVDAGHGGADPGAQGIVTEAEMTAQTAAALVDWLEKDPNFIPLATRDGYDVTAKPSERAAYVNALAPQLLLSVHGNSAPEGSDAAGFECYPSVPGRTWHPESFFFAEQLAAGMQSAGAQLRGKGGIRYIYYEGEVKRLVESNHEEVREERSFTILEDVNCPAVLAEQCFVTSAVDVAQFGDSSGCIRVARIYYEAICAYFGTQPLPE